jgi:oxygen-dependent protoporphyrinogen oxidase
VGSDGDESVYDFGVRHFGPKLTGQLLDPLCVGIFGGDARTLSVTACFPFMTAFEKVHPSLLVAQLFYKNATKTTFQPPVELQPLLSRVGRARLWSLLHGMESLPHALATHLADMVRLLVALLQPYPP